MQPAKRELYRSLPNTTLRKKTPKTEVEQTDVKVDNSGESELKLTVYNLSKALNKITTTSMCAIVLRIAFAQDALRNRQLLINFSWNWKGSKPKMLFFEDKQQS